MKTLRVRASSADLAWKCAESVVPASANGGGGGVQIDTAGEAADLGTAFHRWAEDIGNASQDTLTELSNRYRVNRDDLERLASYAAVAWKDLSRWFENGQTEFPYRYHTTLSHPTYSGLELTGTVDRVHQIGDTLYILDWKTGWLEGYEHQPREYALIAAMQDPEIARVVCVTAYVRLAFYDTKTYTRGQLLQWLDDLKTRLCNGLGRFSPGDHCGHCSRLYDCPGAKRYTQESMSLLASEPVVEITLDNKAIEGPKHAETLRKIRFIETRCKEFRDALRDSVKNVGPLPAGDGKVLRLVSTQRRALDAMKAWPVLADWLSQDEINSACTVSLSKCQNAVASRAASGKGEARRELLEALEEVGAVRTSYSESLRETKDAEQ